MVHSPLVTRFALTSDYSARPAPVDSIGHHHAAGTSLEVALALFQPGGRTVSPNYCIRGRDIVLVVPEEYRAWTSSDAWADGRSITYEIINSTGSPAWSFDPETLDSVVALDADICKRYGIQPRHAIAGFWEHRNLYEWYGRSYATSCAGPSFHIDDIINRTNAALSATPSKPRTLSEKGDPMQVLKNIRTGRTYGIAPGLLKHHADPAQRDVALLFAGQEKPIEVTDQMFQLALFNYGLEEYAFGAAWGNVIDFPASESGKMWLASWLREPAKPTAS